MFRFLFLTFVCLPFADLFLLLKVGSLLGFWPTVALVLLTGFAGAALARWQGISTLSRIQSELAAGRMPAAELADGAMILVAAALLVTPGFITDAIGIILLIPPARRVVGTLLTRYFRSRIVVSSMTWTENGPGTAPFSGGPTIFESGAEAPGRMKYVRNESTDGGAPP